MSDEAKQRCLERLKYHQSHTDIEGAHYGADDALIEFIRELGHNDVADEWEKVDKWYA